MSEKLSLMGLVDEALILWDKLTDDEGQLVDNAEELLGINEEQLKSKIDVYSSMIRQKQRAADALNEESVRLSERANREDQNAAWLSDRLKSALNRLGLRKMETEYYTVSLVKNGGKVPLKVLVHPSELPEGYTVTKTVTTTSPDTEKIRAALERGESIGGCALGERGERLVIK